MDDPRTYLGTYIPLRVYWRTRKLVSATFVTCLLQEATIDIAAWTQRLQQFIRIKKYHWAPLLFALFYMSMDGLRKCVAPCGEGRGGGSAVVLKCPVQLCGNVGACMSIVFGDSICIFTSKANALCQLNLFQFNVDYRRYVLNVAPYERQLPCRLKRWMEKLNQLIKSIR